MDMDIKSHNHIVVMNIITWITMSKSSFLKRAKSHHKIRWDWESGHLTVISVHSWKTPWSGLTLNDDVRILWLSSKWSSNLFFSSLNCFHKDENSKLHKFTNYYHQLSWWMLYWCKNGKIRTAMIVIKPKDEILI